MKRKLRIYYLDYNAEKYENRSRDPSKERPNWFSYHSSFRNILKTILEQNSNFEIYFTWWYDKKNEEELSINYEFNNLINNLKNKGNHFEVMTGSFGSGAASAKALFQHLNEFNDEHKDDLIYTCENDYLHKLDWIECLEDMCESNVDFDYISLYDHADNYNLTVHKNFHIKLIACKKQIWKTGFSTCFSKIAKLKTIKEDINILKNYDDYMCFAYLQLLNRKLLIAVPGLSTHAMKGLESPAINWEFM
jgi:hypothetical protein